MQIPRRGTRQPYTGHGAGDAHLMMQLDILPKQVAHPADPGRLEDMDTFSRVIEGDCLMKLSELPSESVHLVVTDPPYFLDGLDTGWKKGRPEATKGTGAVGGLPIGMKFDPKQGRELQRFMNRVANLMIPALCPGAFAVFFSQPRLVPRMAVGLEDAGFEIRDLFAWHFTRRAQFKAFSMDHFVERRRIPREDKEAIKRFLNGRKTPQLRPQFEAIILAQKPKQGTHVDNWIKYKTGLIDATARLDDKVPSTVMTVEKPHRERYNGHLTVKPVRLLDHIAWPPTAAPLNS